MLAHIAQSVKTNTYETYPNKKCLADGMQALMSWAKRTKYSTDFVKKVAQRPHVRNAKKPDGYQTPH